MVRVESQITRQALLQVGTAMEVSPLPEKLELFLEDGTAVDVGKDRTRARWRGQWVIAPDAPYEQNDFVMSDDKLWILADASVLEEPMVDPNLSSSGAWAIMTISAGMKWLGEWDVDTDYKDRTLVRHEGSLYISDGDIASGAAAPGAAPAELTVTTVKAGDAMYGGHNQPARVLVKGEIVSPIPPQLGSEVNIGQDINDRYFKIGAVPGDEVTLQFHGGDISLFDGGSGDALFSSGPASDSPDGPDLTFTVPSITAYHGDVPTYVVVEVGSDVTDLLWVSDDDDVGGWELVLSATPGAMRYMGVWDVDVDYQRGAVVQGDDDLWYVALADIEDNLNPTDPPELQVVSVRMGGYTVDGYMLTPGVPVADVLWHRSYNYYPNSRLFRYDAAPGTPFTLVWDNGQNAYFGDNTTGSSIPGTSWGPSPFSGVVPASGELSIEGGPDAGSFMLEGSGDFAEGWALLPWAEPPVLELPAGGTDGYILAKASADDGDVEWIEAPTGGGGLPVIYKLYDNAQYNTTSNSYTYAGSGQIVVAEDGDYEVSMSAALAVDNVSSGYECRAAVAVDGVIDDGLVLIKSALESPAYAVNSHSVAGRVLSLTAGDVIRPMYKAVGSFGTVYIEYIKIVLRPVTVG